MVMDKEEKRERKSWKLVFNANFKRGARNRQPRTPNDFGIEILIREGRILKWRKIIMFRLGNCILDMHSHFLKVDKNGIT